MGAGRMSDSEIKERNRQTAIEMEEAGKDGKTIWRATGWERGKDGQWRFELPDAKVKLNVLNAEEMKNTNGWYLYDFVEAKELFEAYPELNDIIVRIEDLGPSTSGYYDSRSDEIYLNSRKLEDDIKVLSEFETLAENGTDGANEELHVMRTKLAKAINKTMVHEIQHAIQEIEGFAKGTSPEAAAGLDHSDDPAYSMQQRYKDRIRKRFANFTETARENLGISEERIEDFKNEVAMFLYDKSKDKTESVSEEEASDILKHYAPDADATILHDFMIDLLKDYHAVNAFDPWMDSFHKYFRFAGETESRNIETRMQLSDKKRRETPPSATEDMTRAYQIVRFSVAEDSFDESEKDLMGTIPVRPENTFKSVHDVLSGLRNKSFVNLETSQEAKLSLTGINKMLSGAARKKSKDNGFTDAEHFQAAANIDYLYINGSLIEERGDRDGDPNIRSIKRFASPFYTGKEFAEAIITVKESYVEPKKDTEDKPSQNRLYSIELDEIKKPSDPYVGGLELNPAAPPANDGINKIQQKIEKANEFLKKIEKNSDDTRFSVSPVWTGSAADYEQPSLHYVGTGEGAQVYGWGLYGSNSRSVGKWYAKKVQGRICMSNQLFINELPRCSRRGSSFRFNSCFYLLKLSGSFFFSEYAPFFRVNTSPFFCLFA